MSICAKELERFTEVFRALSNPNRLRIYLRLVSCCPPGTKCMTDVALKQCVGSLGEGLGIDLSTVSHHVRELRQSGLIRTERRGKNIFCWIDPEIVLAVTNLLTGEGLPAVIDGMECVSLEKQS